MFQTRRQTRSSTANNQPLSPSCSENIIPEPTKPAQTTVQPLKVPASTASLGKLSFEAVMKDLVQEHGHQRQ